MKNKIINLKNKVVEFLLNAKNKVSTFDMTNKRFSIIVATVLIIVIILSIIFACNRAEVGNTSGNLNNSGFSVEKNGWVYYLGLKDSNTDGIYRVKLNSDKKEKISSDYGLYLNKSGKFIYYLDRTSDNYDIVKMKTNGESKETIISNVDAAKILVVDNWIYYFKEAKFYRAKTNGENKQILLEKSIDNYEIIGNWIYYSYINDGKYVIAKMKINGEDVTKIDNDLAKQFFIKGNNIYYIYENYNKEEFKYNYEFYTIKTNGKDKKKIVDIDEKVQLNTINYYGDRIYYAKTDENDNLGIYSMKINGEDETKITDIQGYYTTINIHNKWVYYTDQNENGDSEMFRIRINGEDKQSLSV